MGKQQVNVRTKDDLYLAISATRRMLKKLAFTKLEEQKVLVSVSELTRNVLDHTNSPGVFLCEIIDNGIRISVVDKGPGIDNIEEVLNGVKSKQSKGLGIGLSGVKRLMDEFNIKTSQKEGTKVVAIKWKTT